MKRIFFQSHSSRNTIGFLTIILAWAIFSPTASAQSVTGTVDFDALSLRTRTQATVSLSDGTTLTLIRSDLQEFPSGDYVWIASVQSDARGSAVISASTSTASGRVEAHSRLFSVDLAQGISLPVRELDRTAFLPELDPLIPTEIFDDGFEPTDSQRVAGTCPDPISDIRVLVVYTAAARNGSPAGNIANQIRTAIAMANFTFAGSSMSVRLRMVHSAEVSYDETGTTDLELALDRLKGRSDGFMDEIHQKRDDHAADIVVLLVEDGDAAGMAYQAANYLWAPDRSAFAVVRRDHIHNHTFTHEVGHVFGAEHDRYVVLSQPLFANNYGYVNLTAGWRTVMAYENACDDAQPTVQCDRNYRFSSPLPIYLGMPTGDADNDNREHILDKANVVACFREGSGVVANQPLNDTGQDWCANNTTGNLSCPQASFPDQDGDHGRDALARAGQLTKIGGGEAGFDFTKISNSGDPLPASAALGSGPNDWGCTRDNLTGLIWEVKTNNGASLRHMNHTYTWYDTNSSINGGNAGTIGTPTTCNSTLSHCNTSTFVAAVNAQGLCGANDWRMPMPEDLQSITHSGRFNPAIDPVYFPNTPVVNNPSVAWSGRNFAQNPSDAWLFNSNSGSVSPIPKSFTWGVRLVRGGQ